MIAVPFAATEAVIAFSAADLSRVNVQSTPKSRTSNMSLAHARELKATGFPIRLDGVASVCRLEVCDCRIEG